MQKRASLNQRFNGVAAERFIKKAAPTGAIANSADDIISAVGNKLKLFGQEHGATMGKGALGIAGAAGTAKAYQALAKRYGVAQANKIMAGAVGGSAALGGAGYGAKKLFDAYGDDVAGYLASAGARAGALKDDVAGYLASAGARAGALKDMLKLPSTETLGVKSLLGEDMLPAQLTGSALGAVGVGAGALGTAKAYQALAKRYGAARANKIMAGAVGGSAALGGAGYGAKKLFDAYGDDAMTYLKELGLKDLQFQGM